MIPSLTQFQTDVNRAIAAKEESPKKESGMFYAYQSGVLIAVLWRLIVRYPGLEKEIRELIAL